jgi:ribosomal protein L11 methyltransferase
LRLTIHPGQALGTGDHPATQLCLEALEKHLPPSAVVLDVGAGSGILMAGAALLGARHVAGCDIEYDSIAVAYRNLLTDALPPHVFAGSTRAVRAQSVDLLVANINAVTHETLADEYARVARRCLILSGFPDRHAARVRAALQGRGFDVVETIEKNEWVCLVLCNEDNS